MARLHMDEILSACHRTAIDYPDASHALNVYAARLLTILADKHEKDAHWNEKQATRLEGEIDTLDKEINRG